MTDHLHLHLKLDIFSVRESYRPLCQKNHHLMAHLSTRYYILGKHVKEMSAPRAPSWNRDDAGQTTWAMVKGLIGSVDCIHSTESSFKTILCQPRARETYSTVINQSQQSSIHYSAYLALSPDSMTPYSLPRFPPQVPTCTATAALCLRFGTRNNSEAHAPPTWYLTGSLDIATVARESSFSRGGHQQQQ